MIKSIIEKVKFVQQEIQVQGCVIRQGETVVLVDEDVRETLPGLSEDYYCEILSDVALAKSTGHVFVHCRPREKGEKILPIPSSLIDNVPSIFLR